MVEGDDIVALHHFGDLDPDMRFQGEQMETHIDEAAIPQEDGDARVRRTVPFLLPLTVADIPAAILDQNPFPAQSLGNQSFLDTLARSLDISSHGPMVPADVAELLMQEQYEACMALIGANPTWQQVPYSESPRELRAYILEFRHYIASASARMSAGPAGGEIHGSLTRGLVHHLIEEADHSHYFENALAAIDCPVELVTAARPFPRTIEWVHVMRAFGSQDPLVAALCSGLMEYSNKRANMKARNELIVERGLLPRTAIAAMYEHDRVDNELDHGENWRLAIQGEGSIAAPRLRNALNAVTIMVEMMIRWVDSLDQGLSGDLVEVMPLLELGKRGREPVSVDRAFDGLPVWPAHVYHQVAYGGAGQLAEERKSIAVMYAYGGAAKGKALGKDVAKQAGKLAAKLAGSKPRSDIKTTKALEKLLLGPWMDAVAQHSLWEEMLERPTLHLLYGWVLENYHLMASAGVQISTAIKSCPDPVLRRELVRKLEEEMDQSQVLRKGLECYPSPISIDCCRPLPTTVAFHGYLRDLAGSSWKAYLIGTAFLQFTKTKKDSPMHEGFYEGIKRKAPDLAQLVEVMQVPGKANGRLDHPHDILKMLVTRHGIDSETLQRAALVPQLAWSFLDGIRTHYTRGPEAIVQRIGWTA